MFKRGDIKKYGLPLQLAADLGREEICMYLLTLTGADDDLNLRWTGMHMCHHTVKNENVSFFKALVERGVDLDVRSDGGYTPLAAAIKMCHMPPVRLLLGYFQAQRREREDVVRDLTERLPTNDRKEPFPLIFCLIQHRPSKANSLESGQARHDQAPRPRVADGHWDRGAVHLS